MDVLLYLTTLALGFFIGVTTVVTVALKSETKEDLAERRRAVQALAEKLNISYEEADAQVVYDPYWPR